jgi:ornithine decarboxylase
VDQVLLPTERIEDFLTKAQERTPFVVVDLDVVVEHYRRLEAALPSAEVFYAIKANPAPEILRLLVGLGSSFDVASPAEVDACLAAGADPARISYGNTVKKRADIAYAHRRGVRLFAFDSDDELDKIIAAAPGSTAFCRISTSGLGADWPLSRKCGCPPQLATQLLERACAAGLEIGLSFHVGSQQRDIEAWDDALAVADSVFVSLEAAGIQPSLINLGGGFPAQYLEAMPEIEVYGHAIERALVNRMRGRGLRVLVEPGRYLVGDAGVLHTEVVLVAERVPGERWVYLDCGVFGGLAETLGEAIRYRIRAPHASGPWAPAAIAGPTCDSADVLYEKSGYLLPLGLRAGDHLQLLSTGAYTTTYSSIGFNGFEPLRSYYLTPTTDRTNPTAAV